MQTHSEENKSTPTEPYRPIQNYTANDNPLHLPASPEDDMLDEFIYEFNEEDAEERESRYRRAYSDGFLGAVEAMEDLMRRHHLLDEIFNRLLHYWDGPLDEWGGDDCTLLVTPPEI